jgi:hypothetical protein
MPKTAANTATKQTRKCHRRPTEVVYGRRFWTESYQGTKIWIDPETMGAFDSTNFGGIGLWDDATKTIILE